MGVFYHSGIAANAAQAQPIRITGRVLDAGQPFAGARVELHPSAPVYEDALRQLSGESPVPVRTAKTDRNGSFEILAPESGAWRVTVQANDRLVLENLVEAEKDVSLPEIELMQASTLTIQALGPDGQPLAGLPLEIARPLEDWRRPGWFPAERRGVTGTDGRLTVPRWKLERLSVYVTDPLYLGQVAVEVHGDSVIVRPGSRPRTIEVLGARGEPVAGALVRWWTWPVGITGPDGRLSVSLPDEENPPLLVEGPGGERAQVTPAFEPVAGVLIVHLAPPKAEPGRVASFKIEARGAKDARHPSPACHRRDQCSAADSDHRSGP
ncbi:MAG TPA: hypothetical protein VFR31_14880 [Thermoanaerobaculia bacterium]|nr:hypothetical protein [Thermoanaerobaculia bacterium]